MKKKYITPESATYSFISEGALLLNSLTGKSIETKTDDTATSNDALSNKQGLWDDNPWSKD